MDSNNEKIAGALLFVGGLQFTVGMIIAEAVYPNYSVSENYISDWAYGVSLLPLFLIH